MAEAATLEAPAAAPISTPPLPPASSSPAINVTPAAIDQGPTAPPPRPGSAKERMFQDLRKKAGMEEETKPAAKSTTPDAKGTSSETSEETTESTTEAPPAGTEAPAAEAKKGKVSPWKLVDEHKAARLKAETELAELRKALPDPAKVKELETRAQQLERQYQEAQEQLRFENYAKSDEFKTKYQQPYEDAWKRWMGELGELTVQDSSTGEERNLQPQDILELVNLPLQKAREQAESTFGSFANDVMSARKEIRSLFEAQNKALEEAKKMGAERTTKQQQEQQARQEALAKEITTTWKQANDLAVADEKFGKFFKPVEGDTEGNTRLTKGFEIADRAFAVSPLDPRLTPEQRAEVVRLHAAVRNRAAAFGRLSYQNEKLSAEIAALKAELGKYKGSQPGAGEGQREKPEIGHSSARESVFAALRAKAH